MDNIPLVSVSIPCYNHENYVEQTLNSVLLESYENKEIIIIDDSSTDNSWNVIENWVRNNSHLIQITHLRNERNLGVSKTVNKIHKLCSGEFIVGIASDDQLVNGSIKKRVEYLQKNFDKKVVFGDCYVVDENDKLLYESGLSELYNIDKSKLLDDKSIRYELISNWGVPGGTLMMKKELINEFQFNEKLIIEDFDLFLKWMSKNYLGFIDEKISKYRLHSSNASRNRNTIMRRYIDFSRTILGNLKYYNIKYKFILISILMQKIIKVVFK